MTNKVEHGNMFYIHLGGCMAWVLFIVVLIGIGIFAKWRNTIYMRKLAADLKITGAKPKPSTPDDAHDSLGVAEMGVEILGKDNV